MSEKLNPFEIAQAQLDNVVTILKLEPSIHAMLRRPMRELHVSLPVRMDNGSVKVFRGFRVQYNDARGPCKGGIRFHPDETIDTVRALAAWMTWKTALANLPFGGGKGGIICNPKEMSVAELERLTRATETSAASSPFCRRRFWVAGSLPKQPTDRRLPPRMRFCSRRESF